MRDARCWAEPIGDSSARFRVGKTERNTGQAYGSVAAARATRRRRADAAAAGLAGTLRPENLSERFIANFRGGRGGQLQKARAMSGFPSVAVLRDTSIRKKIIGHARRFQIRFGAAEGRRPELRGAFPLLEQQPRHSGAGLIRQPLIHQRHDLLAQVGGIRQTRQFKVLQRVFGSGQQKFPRRLDRANGHGALQSAETARYGSLRLITMQ